MTDINWREVADRRGLRGAATQTQYGGVVSFDSELVFLCGVERTLSGVNLPAMTIGWFNYYEQEWRWSYDSVTDSFQPTHWAHFVYPEVYAAQADPRIHWSIKLCKE